MGKLIYITGADGTGKTTQAKLLLSKMRTAGLNAKSLWLRFPFFFSLPLLVYARWRGYSWREENAVARHGYWDFGRSWLLRVMLPWTLLLDAALAAIGKIYLPLWLGQTIVCERFVLDMLVDLEIALADPNLHRRLPGRLYPRLLPRQAIIFVFDLDAATIRARRPDLRVDRRLKARLEAFRRLAADQKLVLVSSQLPMAEVEQYIWTMVQKKHFLRSKVESNKMGQKKAGYAKLKSKPLVWLLRYPFVAVMAHWAVQSLFYMDTTERWFKIGLDIGLTGLIGLVLSGWVDGWMAWPTAFLMAHTLNFLLNGHLWGVLKHYNLIQTSPDRFENYVKQFQERAQHEPAIGRIVICGSLSRQEWKPASDLDARLVRQPGLINGLRACWFLLRERSRALLAGFPLDVYVMDNEISLQKLNPKEIPSHLYKTNSSSKS